ncbi:hypothetical protein GB937_009501 [Aspergillus fischeri]|nr:hypothetical protein GB937_009501 [Aspergillus fischeri]
MPPAVGNVYVLRVSVVSECPTDLEPRRSARLVNFAVVESAKTYSVIIATVGIAALSARQVQIASVVSASAIFQARPPVMEHVLVTDSMALVSGWIAGLLQ